VLIDCQDREWQSHRRDHDKKKTGWQLGKPAQMTAARASGHALALYAVEER